MSESKKPIDQQVTEWLETQGYPLEMYVAQTIQDAWFRTTISSYYEDFETHQSREIDIIATRTASADNPLLATVSCQIECKLARSKPWVMFFSQAQPRIHPIGCIIPSLLMAAFLDRIRGTSTMEAIADLPLFHYPYLAYGITQALTTSKDMPYEAVMGTVKASVAQAQKLDSYGRLSCGIAIPIVVMDGLLFEGRIDSTGHVTTTQIESGVVHWQRPNPSGATPFVYIVTKPVLNSFIEQLVVTIDGFLDIVGEQMPIFEDIVRRKRIPRSAYKT